ncbi:rod shape-determining protein MreC [uncultured Enterococcus sp.]|uniref:rod shape-determining protein MreC n=1 Tax=uncultured Enterococcus sp. TaxID=167972 RepID=UPI0025E48753|nr:rod shape-determining protein MreC [uncultured Enterococcus sp.]
MKKINPNKNIIIALIIVIIVVTILSVTIAKRAVSEKTNVVQSTVNDSIALVDRVIQAPFNFISKTVDNVQDLFTTYEENQRLKEKIDHYEELSQQTKNDQREISSLKEQLELNNTLTSFEKVTANVISRSPDTWQDFLIIDKGSKDGIELNMSVMATKGLVGRVIEVNRASSKIELLTAENQTSNHFPVRISTKDGVLFGLLKGFDEEKNALIVEQVTGDAKFEKGDVVQTSGLGGNSPADLAVGTVLEARSDDFGLQKKLYVQPYAKMYDLSVVTVIKRTVGE